MPAARATQPPPGQRAIEGRDGWIFLDGELLRACARFIPYATAMNRWVSMVNTIRRSGRRVVLVIPPDKSTIYPEKIGGKNPAADCMAEKRAEAWRAMESTGNRDVVPLRRPILARKRAGSELLYKRKDTHWNGAGAEIFIRETLRALNAGVQVGPGEFRPVKEVYQGDLTGLLGAPREGHHAEPQARPSPRRAVVRGRTLFLYDSFGIAAIDNLRPYFETLDPYHWDGPPDCAATRRPVGAVVRDVRERPAGRRRPRRRRRLRATPRRRGARGRRASSLTLPVNSGYGAALQTGYKYAVRHGYDLVGPDRRRRPAPRPRYLPTMLARAARGTTSTS